MSALSISGVASSGNSAQAQPGAPDAAADTSPFDILLAAIAAADPALADPALADSALQASAQAGAAQVMPATAATQPAGPTNVEPANDDDAAPEIDPTIEVTATGAQPSPADPDDVAVPKSGKPEKKNATARMEADTAAIPAPQSQMPVLPQPPIAPMAQAAVQTQAVASQNDDSEPSIAADAASNTNNASPPMPTRAAPGRETLVPAADRSQSASSSDQADTKDIAAQTIASPQATTDEDDAGDILGDIANDIALAQAAQAGGAKSAPVRSQVGKPASQPAPETAMPVADDADADVAPSNARTPIASSQVSTLTQPAPDNTPPVSVAQQTPKPETDKADKSAPDRASALPQTIPVATNINAQAQTGTSEPSVAANDNSDSKPAHAIASNAAQPQADAPQPASGVAAMPQNLVALNPTGSNQPGGMTLSVHVATHDTDSSAPSQSSASTAPTIDALAVSVAARSLSGAKQFDIRLDPPELGRVEVRLSIDASGKTQAHMTADQPQTLELLQKDAPNLTRALRDAGLDVSQNGLNFSLKGQSQNGSGQNGNFGGASRGLSLPATTQSIETAQPANISYSFLGNARLDIHV